MFAGGIEDGFESGVWVGRSWCGEFVREGGRTVFGTGRDISDKGTVFFCLKGERTMAAKVPYSYVERKIKESAKYQRAIEKWGKKAVDEISIPYLIYIFNLFREHGMLHLRRRKSEPITELELLFGNNPVGIKPSRIQKSGRKYVVKLN
jgi:hypothetical protein